VLAVGGTYTLLIEGRVWREWPTDYRLAVYTVPDPVAVPITLDGPNPDVPRVEPGKTGSALTLRGVDYVEIPYGPEISPTRNLTLEGWFKFDRFTDTWNELFTRGDPNVEKQPYGLSVNSSGAISAGISDATGAENLSTANEIGRTGEWMHVAMVANRDEGTLKIFVNGVEQASRTIRGGNTYQNTNPLWITHTS